MASITLARGTVPAHWQVAEAAKLRGRVVRPGMALKIRGERGTFRFVRHVTLTTSGREWVDVRDAGGALRAFYVDRVRSVPRNAPAARPVRSAA